MSVQEIKTSIRAIKKLPPEERAKVSGWAMKELSEETPVAIIETALRDGQFEGLYTKAMRDYWNGKALDRID